MRVSGVRFGDIGVIYGPKEAGETLLAKLRETKTVYAAENWSSKANTEEEPRFAYYTGVIHMNEAPKKPDYPTMQRRFSEEYPVLHEGRGPIGEYCAQTPAYKTRGDKVFIHRIKPFSNPFVERARPQ